MRAYTFCVRKNRKLWLCVCSYIDFVLLSTSRIFISFAVVFALFSLFSQVVPFAFDLRNFVFSHTSTLCIEAATVQRTLATNWCSLNVLADTISSGMKSADCSSSKQTNMDSVSTDRHTERRKKIMRKLILLLLGLGGRRNWRIFFSLEFSFVCNRSNALAIFLINFNWFFLLNANRLPMISCVCTRF